MRAAIDQGLAASTASPAERLEAAYVLIAQAVAPASLAAQLQLLADALEPERLQDAEQACHDGRSLVLTKKRLEPGWRLRGELTDEVGAALQAELDARAAARARREAALRKAARGGSGDQDLFGTVGPGTPADDDALGAEPSPWLGPDQLAHDLLGELLDAFADADVREAGSPAPTPVTVIADLASLEGRLGALPGTLLLPTGPVPLSTKALRRHGCHSKLTAVLLDAARHPVERPAPTGTPPAGNAAPCTPCGACTARPRPAARPRPSRTTTRRGSRPAAPSSATAPLCPSHHHDVHDGHRAVLLRDGRRIDENGWVEG